MSGLTQIKDQQAWPTSNEGVTILTGDGETNGVLTISSRDGEVSTFVRPNRMDSLPDDVIQLIFTRLLTTKNLSAFSATCNRMYTISCNIPLYVFSSDSLLGKFFFLHNTEFKTAATQLIQTIEMEPVASFQRDFHSKQYRLLNPSLELLNAHNTFYLNLTRWCIQLNAKIDCEKFFNDCKTAARNVRTIYSKISSDFPMNIEIKMHSVFNGLLYDRVYKLIINTFNDQLNISVTPQKLKLSVLQINAIFTEKNVIDIEADLRNALRMKYGKAFQQYAFESLDAFPTSKIVVEMQQQLTASLEAERAAIEAELGILCGPNKFNGTINDAYMEMEALMNMADEPVDEAKAAVAEEALREAMHGVILFASPYELDLIRHAHNELIKANQSPSIFKRKAANDKYLELIARLDTLAQWEEGTDILIGGRLFEVCKKLEDIGFISLFNVRQRGQFCIHLTRRVTEENKEALYNSLLKFSNSQPDAP